MLDPGWHSVPGSPDPVAVGFRSIDMNIKVNFLLAAILLLAPSTPAAVLYVNALSPNPQPPYPDWSRAARNIQDAVDAATAGDVVIVTNGLYATGGRAIDGTMTNRVAVDKPITLHSVNGPGVTVIQGWQVPNTTNGDGAIRCVYLVEGASLSGFTLTNGATRGLDGAFQEQSGGGLYCQSYASFATNCVLTGNSCSRQGGGVSGGTLRDCVLTGNTARTGGAASGTMLDHCALIANTASEGGATYGATVVFSTLARNSAIYAGAASEGTLEDCRLMDNTALHGGASAWSDLRRCTLTGNQAGESGGGVFSCGLNNCLLSGNFAFSQGGGAWGSGLYNCTVVANLAGDSGGGVDSSTLYNCIAAYNSASSNGNYSASTLAYSCTAPLPPSGPGNIAAPPLFVDQLNGNLRLQSNSPCINAGDNASARDATDLDGRPRKVGGVVDMGACEFQKAGMGEFICWLAQCSLPTDGSADFTDPDRDGLNNWQEWQAGTDPTNAASVLRLFTPARVSTSFSATWQSVPGRAYFIERSSSASSPPVFTPLATNLVGDGSLMLFIDKNAAPTHAIYRIGVL